jgi:hypothetical protein
MSSAMANDSMRGFRRDENQRHGGSLLGSWLILITEAARLGAETASYDDARRSVAGIRTSDPQTSSRLGVAVGSGAR